MCMKLVFTFSRENEIGKYSLHIEFLRVIIHHKKKCQVISHFNKDNMAFDQITSVNQDFDLFYISKNVQ